MKLRVVQCNCVLGVPAAGLAAHVDAIRRAAAEGVDLLVFPELSLTGYLLRDLAGAAACTPEALCAAFDAALGDVTAPLEFVAGFALRDRDHRLYNAYAHFRREGGATRVLGLHRKVNLPDYGMFEESRFFNPGRTVRAYDSPLTGRTGLLICEDAWHPANALVLACDGPAYAGARVLIIGSASPVRDMPAGSGVPANVRRWHQTAQLYSGLFASLVVMAQRTGVEDGLTFAGASAVYGPDETCLARAPLIDDAEITVEIDLNAELDRARERFPGASGDDADRLYRELTRIRAGV